MIVYPRSPTDDDLTDLQARLGVSFWKRVYLFEALTHSSWVEARYRGDSASAHYSQGRLAFLGDALFTEVVARTLYFARRRATEEDLTLAAEAFRRGGWLAERGRELGLDQLLAVGRGAVNTLKGNSKAIENTTLAVLGALVADEKTDAAKRIITRWIQVHEPPVLEALTIENHPNPIGALNELYQQLRGHPAPAPSASSFGPAHELEWVVSLDLTDIGLGAFCEDGNTKKAAHTAACRQALRNAKALGLIH